MAYPASNHAAMHDASLITTMLASEDALLTKISQSCDLTQRDALANSVIEELTRFHRRVLAAFVSVPAECIAHADTMLRERVTLDLRLRKILDHHLRGENIGVALHDLIGAWYTMNADQQDAFAAR
jgi:hypothetical protein